MSASTARTLRHLTHVPAERSAVHRESDATGFALLSERDYAIPPKSSRDFFILGSGSSVLDLGSRDWDAIKSGTSVGVNSWAFHSFVPDILALEDVHSEKLLPQRRAIEKALNRLTTGASIPRILKFRASNAIQASMRIKVPQELGSSVRVYGRFQIPPTQHPSGTRRAIRAGLTLDRTGLLPKCLLVDHGASIVRMTHFALRAGAQRIIFAGVDLVNSEYFFEADPSFLARIGEPPFIRSTPSKVHGTVATRQGSGSVIDFMREYTRVLWAERGIEVLALNPNKKLGGFIPAISF